MIQKSLFIYLILAASLPGCGTTPSLQGPAKEILLGVFQGNLPCADCPGIQTVLTLTQEGKYVDIGHFTLKETYLERSVKPLMSRGEWTVIKGTAQNPNAVVYELRPEGSRRILYYLKISGIRVKALDREGNEIDSKMNFTLRKIR